MKLLFVADGRSAIALNWIRYFIAREHEVHLVSTFQCVPEPGLASFSFVPVAFSEVKPGDHTKKIQGNFQKNFFWSASMLRSRTLARQWLGPFTIPHAGQKLRAVIGRLHPDLVHAMRIPYEGMLATAANPVAPFLISIWGNDFTLHAPSTPWMAAGTRKTLHRVSGLHADCFRDIRLAHAWGFPEARPYKVLPGAGGVQSDLFFPGSQRAPQPLVINPRGFRAYIRTDTFIRSIPIILKKRPDVRFVCPAMDNEYTVHKWVEELGIGQSIELLPPISRSQMAELFRKAWVAVSPSTHDGTPNTLLEAMACGCFPVAGDLESIREWIVPGINGLLVDPSSPQELAEAILEAVNNVVLRKTASEKNLNLIRERAAYERVMAEAERFYLSLIC